MEAAWTLGYLTAASRLRDEETLNFTRDVSGSSVEHWLDNYCAAHPLETIATAADDLMTELITRASKNRN
jgi:hypothetical protein